MGIKVREYNKDGGLRVEVMFIVIVNIVVLCSGIVFRDWGSGRVEERDVGYILGDLIEEMMFFEVSRGGVKFGLFFLWMVIK